jgi:hypothetical protein
VVGQNAVTPNRGMLRAMREVDSGPSSTSTPSPVNMDVDEAGTTVTVEIQWVAPLEGPRAPS